MQTCGALLPCTVSKNSLYTLRVKDAFRCDVGGAMWRWCYVQSRPVGPQAAYEQRSARFLPVDPGRGTRGRVPFRGQRSVPGTVYFIRRVPRAFRGQFTLFGSTKSEKSTPSCPVFCMRRSVNCPGNSREFGNSQKMESTRVNAAIVQTIIDMARNLEMESIAEGVETENQFALLKEHGCDLFQGYYFGHPAPVEEDLEAGLLVN
ncbi:MAG: EAL domain-containing protein [Gammaproteobacteria bacterium]|nr:EAL domain-containing protein [Gammaproteobacteria bacterium]